MYEFIVAYSSLYEIQKNLKLNFYAIIFSHYEESKNII